MDQVKSAERWLALALVGAASCYTIVLCFLHTAGAPVNNTMVAAADGLVIVGALALIFWSRPDILLLPLLALAANFLIIALMSTQVDLKTIRDALLIVAFLQLGRMSGDFRTTRTIFFFLAGLVLVLGAFEFFAPGAFVQVFNVLQFYVMRGEVTDNAAQYVDSSLFVSGMRGEERMLAPGIGLGAHRVASIFLEPVSAGNFGAIAVAFGLSLSKEHWRTALAAGLIGALVIILADARFAAFAALLFVLARVVPPRWRIIVIAPAPVIAIVFLMVMGELVRAVGDDLPTRLAISGRAIAGLDMEALFGLTPGGSETIDSGFAYVITAFGLPFSILMWLAFVTLPEPGPQSSAFKLMIGLYICSLLCISGSSLFALKTAGLLWFLYGCLLAEEGAALRSPLKRFQRAAGYQHPGARWATGPRTPTYSGGPS